MTAAVIVGADGLIEIDFGDGFKGVANVFSWTARLNRENLSRTTVADDYRRRTAGLGDWTGSLSLRLVFSEDDSIAYSAWNILKFAIEGRDDELKAQIRLVLQLESSGPGTGHCDFQTTIAERVELTGTVVLMGPSLDCTDPTEPIICDIPWEADGPLALERA